MRTIKFVFMAITITMICNAQEQFCTLSDWKLLGKVKTIIITETTAIPKERKI